MSSKSVKTSVSREMTIENSSVRHVTEDQLNALISRNPIFFSDKAIESNGAGTYTIIQMFEDILNRTRS